MAMQSDTYDDSVDFNVRVESEAGIHSIFIGTDPVYVKKGQHVFFSTKRKLEAGCNDFHFIAFNEKGVRAEKKIRITRKIPAIERVSSRLTVR